MLLSAQALVRNLSRCQLLCFRYQRERLTSRVVAQVAQMRQQLEYAAAAAAAGVDPAQYAAMGNGPK